MSWLWAIPGTLTLLIVGAVAYQLYAPPDYPPFSFRAYTSQDKIQVEWDATSPVVLAARQAIIEMTAGAHTRRFSLTAPQLRDGKASYPRPDSDTDLRMTVYPAHGSPVQAFARLVGPAETPSLSDVDQLKAEVERLKQELSKERRKNKKPPITVP